jgi:hypothetical protein
MTTSRDAEQTDGGSVLVSEGVAVSPADAARERARAAGMAMLAAAPWVEVAGRALLLLVRPPAVAWAEAASPTLWLILDTVEARALPLGAREALLADGVTRDLAGADVDLAVFTSEATARTLDASTRHALEVRWALRHAEALHDPLHRAPGLAAAAGRLPIEALERVVRPLYVQAVTALGALLDEPSDGRRDTALLLLAEAAAPLARLACVLEEGTHPPTEWLLPAARETRLGKRIASWLDDIVPAVAGDARAARWTRESGAGVLREVAAVLRTEFAGRDWLRDPETYALRPSR